MKMLNLSKCENISHIGIASLTNGAQNLEKLILSHSLFVTTDLAKCLLSFPRLQLVKLDGCLCQLLEELDVTDTEIDDQGLRSISRCTKLSSLKLGICLMITDNGLKHIASSCSGLKHVDLNRTSRITDEGIVAIALGCPSLEVVNIAYTSNITDTSLVSLSKCQKLRTLEIRGCTCI
uniref:F-box/LRR-repeat protein 3 n=1 Tax=Cajanus cajan TaxID=3821 RepID=A0A151U0W4_CAJCA|nr:F-box/LRR-repeat protein 3 [Cajanus cajan]